MIKFHIITLFPEIIESYVSESIIGRAVKNREISVEVHYLRKFAFDKHKTVDGRPFSGGPGMVLRPEPILRAVDHIRSELETKPKIVTFSPRGRQFDSGLARRWSSGHKDLIFICGRYEGIDARVKKILRAEEVTIGPYVLTGGELPALAVLDAVSRFKPGVLGKTESLEEERAEENDRHLFYTRPSKLEYDGRSYKVPSVLLSGDRAKIAAWYRRLRKET